jgi:stringent starvation protein B
MNALESSSTRPYLLRALYEWCTDNGFTPYVAVAVDDTVQVPREYVKDGEIVLNVSYDATSSLQIGSEFIEFKARFAGVPRDIMVPVGRVMAIYARENGQGMAFPLLAPAGPAVFPPKGVSEPNEPRGIVQLVASEPAVATATPSHAGSSPDNTNEEPPRPTGGGRPSLKRVK